MRPVRLVDLYISLVQHLLCVRETVGLRSSTAQQTAPGREGVGAQRESNVLLKLTASVLITVHVIRGE